LKLTIDTESRTLTQTDESSVQVFELYSKQAFELISSQWLKLGWNQKYTYTFTWMGRPIIQLPDDLIRVQEAIYKVAPDVIIETGVAHGGSLVYYASICKAMSRGRVIGVDIDIRAANRHAIEQHELAPLITLVEGDSTHAEVLSKLRSLVGESDKVLVLLDSNHSKAHVLSELCAYEQFVSPGSYIVATDGIMRDLHDVPRGCTEWHWDNPAAAARDFIEQHPDFSVVQPPWKFNESGLTEPVTHWPDGWLQRIG
jgi:cephalosporin hydroxylase